MKVARPVRRAGRRNPPHRRQVEPALSDSQYMSGDYPKQVIGCGMVQSVGRTGVCWDISVAQSAWSSLKRELVSRYRPDPAELEPVRPDGDQSWADRELRTLVSRGPIPPELDRPRRECSNRSVPPSAAECRGQSSTIFVMMTEVQASVCDAPRTSRHRRRFARLSAPVLALLAASCATDSSDTVANTDPPLPVDVLDELPKTEDVAVDDVATATTTTATKRCSLFLHGAGWNNNVSDSYNAEGIHELQPPSPDGAFWLYDGPHNYSQSASTGAPDYQRIVEYLRDYVTANDCGPLVVRGTSNGGGLAAKLYCRGEDFGGRAWGYIVEDPVMDVAVEGCSPSPRITRTYFNHSDELRDEAASTSSRDFDCEYAGWGWYCEDNTTMTLETYASHIGTESVRSCVTHSGEGCTYTLSGLHMNYVFWEEYDQ